MISMRPSYWFFIQKIKIRPSQLTFVFCSNGDAQIELTTGCRETNLALQLQKSSKKWLNGALIQVFCWASDPPLKVMSIWSQILDKFGHDMQIHPWWCVSLEDAENGNATKKKRWGSRCHSGALMIRRSFAYVIVRKIHADMFLGVPKDEDVVQTRGVWRWSCIWSMYWRWRWWWHVSSLYWLLQTTPWFPNSQPWVNMWRLESLPPAKKYNL